MKPNKDTAVEIIVEALTQSIECGTLKAGDKLPTLKQMEELYCVSRIVIREAIKVLEGKGLIYSRQGSGIYVTEKPMASNIENAFSGDYSFEEMVLILHHLCDFAVFELKKREDLSELKELQKLNAELLENYSKLSDHRKFSYETTFGARLIRLSGSRLAYDIYLMMIRPIGNMDYLFVSNNADYIEILRIDKNLIEAVLERDPYRACFWGAERTRKTLEALKKKAPL